MKTTKICLLFLIFIPLMGKGVYGEVGITSSDVTTFFSKTVGKVTSSLQFSGDKGFVHTGFNTLASSMVSGFVQPYIRKTFFDPKLSIFKGKGKLYTKKPKGVFYNTHLQVEIDRYVDILQSLELEDIKPHFVFRGPPGTGKTLLAKLIAQRAGFKYEFISGASILQFSEAEAIKEMSELFTRIDKKAKKRSDVTVVIFDEAQDFLMENFRQQRAIMANVNNFMFTRASEPSANYFFIFTYNAIYPMDERWIRRIDYHIHFDRPDIDTRNKLWSFYIKKQVQPVIKQKGTDEEVKEFIDNIDVISAELSAASEGFTGSNISQISKAIARRLKTAKPWRTFSMHVALNEVNNTKKKYIYTGPDFDDMGAVMTNGKKSNYQVPTGQSQEAAKGKG